jgi:DNA polymerase-4
MRAPTAQTRAIRAAAGELLLLAQPLIESRGLTLIGVALTNLADEIPIQLELSLQRGRDLDAVLDRVKDRFGTAAITRGVLIGGAEDPSVPLLPD